MTETIIEGTFVNQDETFKGQISIDQTTGKITAVGKEQELGTPNHIFGDEHLIFPGMIDVHIHAREDETKKQNHKETYQTANDAAINGGVIATAPMPNTPNPLITTEQLRWHNNQHEHLPVTFINYIGIGPNTQPITEHAPYKVYTGPSVGDLFFKSEEQLRQTLPPYRGKPISFHVEDYDLLKEHEKAPTHTQRRPVACVEKALEYVLELIEEHELEAKLCHWSTGGESFEMIRKHRKKQEAQGRTRTTIEVSPLHLLFDEDMLKKAPEQWPYVQMNPALQSREHRKALIEGLRTGFIDYLATDHAPHTLEEKFTNFKDIAQALGTTAEEAYLHLKKTQREECQRRSCLNGTSGTPQLDTYGLIAAWLIKEQGFSPQEVARVTSYNPGRFINEFNNERHGRIEEGYQGSLTVLDLSKSTTLDRRMIKTKAGWSPFEGITFPGKIAMTIIKGQTYTNEQ